MSKLTAKRVLRYSQPLTINEASVVSVAQEERQIQRALGRAKMELAAAKALDRTAALKIVGWIETLEQLDVDCGKTLNAWLDSGQSGMSNKASALDNLSEQINDMVDVLEHSLQACEFRKRPAKPKKGVDDLIVREALDDLKTIRNEAHKLARQLEAKSDALMGAYDAIDEAADVQNEEVYEEFADEIGDVSEELTDVSERLGLASEQLDSV